MRALTVRQPWAWAIAHGYKTIENRTWVPPLEPGELLAIHAGRAKASTEDLDLAARRLGRRANLPQDFERGAVIAVVRFQRIVEASGNRWFEGPIGWVLYDAVALPSPVKCNGRLGLWYLPPKVEARVLRQVPRR